MYILKKEEQIGGLNNSRDISKCTIQDNREDLRIQRRLKEGIQSSLENNNLNTVTNAPIQRAILGDTANPGKGKYVLDGKNIIQITDSAQRRGGGFDITYNIIYPNPSNGLKGKFPGMVLDSQRGSEKYKELDTARKKENALQKENTEKAREKEKQEREELLAHPEIQWQGSANFILTQVKRLIIKKLNSLSDSEQENGTQKIDGLNMLNDQEQAAMKAYLGNIENVTDPYVAIKPIKRGYAVLSNQGDIQHYDGIGNHLGSGRKIKYLPKHARHCEAMLNELYPESPQPAKATKLHSGLPILRAKSQNCILCSLDAVRRGLPFDNHENEPNYWNYQVSSHAKPLFDKALETQILELIIPCIEQAKAVGLAIEFSPGDQGIVDTLKRIYEKVVLGEDILKEKPKPATAVFATAGGDHNDQDDDDNDDTSSVSTSRSSSSRRGERKEKK